MSDDDKITLDQMPPLDWPTNTPDGLVQDLFDLGCVDLVPRAITYGPDTRMTEFYNSIKGLTAAQLVGTGVVPMLSALIDRSVSDSEERHEEDDSIRVVHEPDAIANASQSAIPLARDLAQFRGVPFIELGPRGQVIGGNPPVGFQVALVDDTVTSGNQKTVKRHRLVSMKVHCNDLYVIWNGSMIKHRHISIRDGFDLHELFRASTFFEIAHTLGLVDDAKAKLIAQYIETYRIA